MNLPGSTRRDPITIMADGTIKQVNPFTGTEVWTVPGRGNRPLTRPTVDPTPLGQHDREHRCAFCSATPLSTPPEKSRMIREDGEWRILHGLLPRQLAETTAEFRRVPNLFEIISYDYWVKNYGYEMDPGTTKRMADYLADPEGRRHVLDIVRTRLGAGGKDVDLPEADLLEYAPAYFGGGHDVIISRRHFTDDATHTDQLASSGTLTPDEHFAFTLFTIDGIDDLYQRNRYAPYVVAFQNWLAPAGASFDHLHKQLVAIDSRSAQSELEIARLRTNHNIYNEWGVDYAGYRNLIIAENDHAVVHAGFGHRYPTLTIYSRSPTPEPWLQSNDEIRGMSDLIHACHAATGAQVPLNEEWHHRPVDLDLPMPWRVNLKWRVSTLAGFEGGTKIFVNTLSPDNIRDRVVSAMYRLRDEGRIAQDIRIATECIPRRNTLLYNPLLQ
jgi:galactose-1-phosphate uridylyltransferase